MPREFVAFEQGLETRIREHVAKNHRFGEAVDTQAWILRGSKLPFYRDTWLAYMAPATGPAALGTRLYFLVRARQRSKRLSRVEPLGNTAGAVVA